VVNSATGTRLRKKIRAVGADDLVHVDADAANALRLIRDPRLGRWLGEMFGCSIVDVHAGSWPASAGSMLTFSLRCPGGAIALGLPTAGLPVLALAAQADAQGAPQLAPLVGARLLASFLATFGQAASASGDRRWQAIGMFAVSVLPADAAQKLVPLGAWDISAADQLQARVLLLSVDPECVVAMQDMLAVRAVPTCAGSASWRVASTLRLATRRWSAALLRSVEVGDVLLCLDVATTDALDAQLTCGTQAGLHWVGQVVINHTKVKLMGQMQVHEGRTDGGDETTLLTASVGELEVPVHFEIDSAALSLAHLSALRPGYVIELSIPVEQAQVRVIACGQIIGKGKLVAIGDALGVQIETLAAGPV
jgi:type III secretion system YscQ/HrcQ family protein